jgi:hypothetical protein
MIGFIFFLTALTILLLCVWYVASRDTGPIE